MPSPIAHTAAGYVVYKFYGLKEHKVFDTVGNNSTAFILAFVFSLMPDLDVIPAFFAGNVSYFHNNFTHSLGSGLIVALIVGATCQMIQGRGFKYWSILALLCYELHVVMDYFTVGRGVMLFWPLSNERYEPAITVFYGLRRSNGLLTLDHVWTLINELCFVLLLLILMRTYEKLRLNMSG
ncbi:MAG: metal-dependent hydrolase [Anaerolineae bacterium]|nr:metal-dependent hydrolase [Anaerolineae bacterium]